MNIQEITTDALRKMADTEGLVIQGCGSGVQNGAAIVGKQTGRMLRDVGVQADEA